MFQLDYRSGVSICDQIVNGIIRLKTLGVLKSGEQLPSVRAFASKLSVNPNTVQKAYGILETGGIICSVRGKGSFICEDDSADSAIKIAAKNDFKNALKNAVDMGLSFEEINEIIEIFKEEKK